MRKEKLIDTPQWLTFQDYPHVYHCKVIIFSKFSSAVYEHCVCASEQEVWATPCLVAHRTSTARQMHMGPAWWSQGFCMMRIQTAASARLNTQTAPRCETLWPLGLSCLCLLLSFLIVLFSSSSYVMAVNSQYILTQHLFVLCVRTLIKPIMCVVCMCACDLFGGLESEWQWRAFPVSLKQSKGSICPTGLLEMALSTVFHSIDPPYNSPLSHCSSGLISAFCWSFNYVSFSPDIILCGLAGL